MRLKNRVHKCYQNYILDNLILTDDERDLEYNNVEVVLNRTGKYPEFSINGIRNEDLVKKSIANEKKQTIKPAPGMYSTSS